MERIGVRELRQNASRYLARVKAGETIEVSERGTLVALLTPPTPDRSERDRLIAEGRLIPAENPTVRLCDVTPVPIPPGGLSSQEILDLLREERLS